MWPAGPSTSSSTILARPFQTLRTMEVPSYSTQVLEPVNGCSRREMCVFHLPISKSKSCWPSRRAEPWRGGKATARLHAKKYVGRCFGEFIEMTLPRIMVCHNSHYWLL